MDLTLGYGELNKSPDSDIYEFSSSHDDCNFNLRGVIADNVVQSLTIGDSVISGYLGDAPIFAVYLGESNSLIPNIKSLGKSINLYHPGKPIRLVAFEVIDTEGTTAIIRFIPGENSDLFKLIHENNEIIIRDLKGE